jgi:beta-1,4-mannosyl-glycoprotein beta-1,4-N-acetylglucosaminyltransferase
MVYDCFTFFNELDLLEIRLNVLKNVADKFVLVEATKNFQGKEKPLFYSENKERFAAFADRIIHVIVDQYPDNPTHSAWIMEYHQRNSIRDGLKNALPDDTIIISDIDEIPEPGVLSKNLKNNKITILRQRMFYYYFNCINATDKYAWNGPVIVPMKNLGQPQDLREMSMQMMALFNPDFKRRYYYRLRKFLGIDHKGRKVKFIENGGWHFSYLGGVKKIIQKLEAFAHSEYNKPEYKDPEKIEQAIHNGEDIFGRGFKYRFVNLDHTFPDYILKNKEKFSEYIFSGENRN